MKNIKAVVLKPSFLIFLCICMVLVLSSFSLESFRANAYKQSIESEVKTSLTGLRIEQITRLGPGTIQVIIKNEYSKDITAVAASSSRGTDFRRNYISAESEKNQKLSPGASDDFSYNANPGENVVITAVLFSDMSFEGDRAAVKGIVDTRKGMKVQLNRIFPYLEALSKEHPTGVKTTLNRIKQIAETLPLEKDDKTAMPQDFEYGLRDGRAFVSQNLSIIEAEMESRKPIRYVENGQLVTVTPDAYEIFRKRFDRLYSYLKDLEHRL
jgi:hypothetical protein